MPSRALVGSLVALWLLTACGGGEPQSQADGDAISQSEYNRAFETFRSCVEVEGAELINVSVDPSLGTYYYEYVDADAIVVTECYDLHFRDAQIGFESNNEMLAAEDAEENRREWELEIIPCLNFNGYELPETLEELSDTSDPEDLQEYVEEFYGRLLPEQRC